MRHDWKKIQKAVEAVGSGMADRIDGDGWKVYRVAKIVRIDLSE